jgi:hypothetical protein
MKTPGDSKTKSKKKQRYRAEPRSQGETLLSHHSKGSENEKLRIVNSGRV